MSAPKAIIQVVIAGAQIFGKAFAAAGRQAYKNAQHRPAGGAIGDAAGVNRATSDSITDRLTREHRMTADEARQILNVQREDGLESMLRNYQHLFKVNSPPPPPEKPVASSRARSQYWSHYLQSKVVRAKERLEAEMKTSVEAEAELTAKTAEKPTNEPPSTPV
ncbi:protein transporter [Fomitiporia mediterranea MF3/22]|uniref:protein transporter n=1 Tax=Fomitiporia mediterranea (strain MF3/22) TaxID=694068 RepID=UPI0004407334|nr:protein transporter [Fomitiporia mediterranea MF3/22]EJD02834.1 protein transporter [Fomitiporia mediterranea MF3/22]